MNKSLLGVYLGMSKLWNQDNFKISDPLDGIDIDKEYSLVMNKKSLLSASLRRMVVRRKEGE